METKDDGIVLPTRPSKLNNVLESLNKEARDLKKRIQKKFALIDRDLHGSGKDSEE
jgi:hypothetical protein